MIRVGIIGTNTSHAGVFAGLLNGVDGQPGVVEGGHVVGAWSSGTDGLSGRHSDAPDLARTFGIERVVSDPADLIGSIDLALVLDDNDGGARHPELARTFLEAGIATYIDKPMALDVGQAVKIFDLAEEAEAPVMSCSALRFASEFSALRSHTVETSSTVVAVGPGDWYNYGIHTVEAALAVLGSGATSVQQSHSANRDVTVINHQDGPRIVITTVRDIAVSFHLTVHGPTGVLQTEIVDAQGFYANTMRAAVSMAASRTSPVGRDTTLEVLAILAAGRRSAETGNAVRIADVWSGAGR